MGEVIRLAERRVARASAARPRPGSAPVVFHFDLSCPFSYLTAESVERLLPRAWWRPTIGAPASADLKSIARLRDAAERRAEELRLPLVWPARHPLPVRSGMRAALRATWQGHGSAFALAAARLAFCGGFDLDDPEVLAEAAAAAGLGLPEVMAAAGDRSRDGEMEATALRLLAHGADRLPVLKVGRTLFCGEHRIAEAAAAVRHRPGVRRAQTQVHNAG